MKRKLRHFLLIICFSTGITVMMESNGDPELNIEDMHEDAGNLPKVFATCLAKKMHGIFECANLGTISLLRSLNNEDVLDYDSVKLERASGQSRDLIDLDYEPKDFGNVVQAAARLMEQRNLKWDLHNIYPGLQMRVGPMLNANGVLEFVVDERVNGYSDRQLGTGRMIVRSLVLPFLLGFKFSLTSLVPLIFGVILVITKKALLLTKVALLLSGILGWSSIVTGGHPYQSGYPINPLTSGFGDFGNHNSYGYDILGNGGLLNHDHRYPHRPSYKAIKNPSDFPAYSQHVVRETVNVYNPEKDPADQASLGNRKKIVWNSRD